MNHTANNSGPTSISARAPAKVNLRLKILAREESGYHQIETIFCAIALADRLEFTRTAPGLELEVLGAELGAPQENLVHRAATAFFSAARIEPAIRIKLEKQVPAGAGLGGGSSDAATTLIALNELFGTPLSPATLFRIGALLGSDVPFFLAGAPRALAWGRGERLLPLPPLPPAPMLLVIPDFAIATADAYRDLAEARAARAATPQPAILDTDRLGSWDTVARIAENDFELSGFTRYPKLRAIKVALQDAGATLPLLAGSGSAIFGIFPNLKTLETAIPLVRVAAPTSRMITTTTAPIG
jgi:4-diphosphocytidyl-2-C-methyl-D-erythritol kinase